MIQKSRMCSIGISAIILCLWFNISYTQEYPGTSSMEDSSGFDHSVYQEVKNYIVEKQKLFDPDRFTTSAGYILGGLWGCSYGAGYSTGRDSMLETCMRRIESKYLRPREQMKEELKAESNLSEGETLLDELQTYYPEAAGKMFRDYLDLLGASIDSVNQAYLYVLEPETTGFWRQFADLPEDSMGNAIDDYVQKSGAEVYQVKLLAVRIGKGVQKLGDELVAFLSNYIRTTGRLY